MARTDDDSWDITESVGATALGVAMARAAETASRRPLFVDPYAQWFIDAAVASGWRSPSPTSIGSTSCRADPDRLGLRRRAPSTSTTSSSRRARGHPPGGHPGRRTSTPARGGCRGSPSTVVYEIDQPKVLGVQEPRRCGPTVRRAVARDVAVPFDLRQDWPKALREAGFDADPPTAWWPRDCCPTCPRHCAGRAVRTRPRAQRTAQSLCRRGLRPRLLRPRVACSSGASRSAG